MPPVAERDEPASDAQTDNSIKIFFPAQTYSRSNKIVRSMITGDPSRIGWPETLIGNLFLIGIN
jgi:hypothetical protein